MAELNADPIFQAAQAEREKVHLEKVAKLKAASKPLNDALRAVCPLVTESVDDLVNTRERYDEALPILFEHLTKDYPSEILEAIARAMAVQEAMPWRKNFIEIIKNRPPVPKGKRDGFRDGLALAIGNTTGPHNVWETIELLRDISIGESRILMLSVLGKVKDPEVRKALLELRENDLELRRAISDLGWVKKLTRVRRTP
jgi:predicted metal-binding protein